MNQENKKPASPFLNGVFLGTILGGLAFFVLGTKEGRQSRQKMIVKGKKLLNNLESILDQIEPNKSAVLPEKPISIRKVIKKVVKKKRFFKKNNK